jgi:iron complex outermembrane recepter protein
VSRLQKRSRRVEWIVCSALCALLPNVSVAQAINVQRFDIPAEDLGRALTQVAKQSRHEIAVSADIVRGKQAAALHGTMTLDAALSTLLAGTGLAYKFSSSGAIVVSAQNAEPMADNSGQPLSEAIVVVGSRGGGRSNFQSQSPVSSIRRAEIEHAAVLPGETGAIIAAFAPSFEFPRYSDDGAADTVRTGQLRGLKPDETLVLINGKRVHTTAVLAVEGSNGIYTAPFDFNTVATNAIQRIEVLGDGAGAQYGSDAIAGVINIVLDQASEGGQMSASYGQYHTYFAPINQTLDDGRTYTFNIDYGWKLSDSGFFHAGLEYQHREASNRAGYTQDQNGVRGPIPWEANPNLPNSAQNTAVALAGRVEATGDGPMDAVNGFFNSEWQIGSAWRGYSFGTFAIRVTDGDAFFRWPADWGGNGPDGNRNPGPAYPDGYRPVTRGVNNDFGATVGAKGTLFGWNSDFSVTAGRDHFSWNVNNSLNPSYGPTSPHDFHLYGAVFSQLTVNADFLRHFDLGFAEPVTVAMGGEYRHENFYTTPGDVASYAAGPLNEDVGAEAGPGVPPEDTSNVSRDTGGIYLDISDNLTKKLSIDGAGRFESYSDFGRTVNGKFSARYEFIPQLALRGAVSTNYRAPSLAQIGTQVSSEAFNTNGTGLVDNLTAAPNGPIAKALGFPNLAPERSTNLSAGVAFKVKNFDASFDFYKIELKDALDVYPMISGDAVSAYLLRVTGRNVQSVQMLENIDALTRSGFDLITSYHNRFMGGNLELGVNATSGVSHSDNNKFPVPSILSSLGYSPQSYQTPVYPFGAQMKIISHVSWRNDFWSIFLRVTRWPSQFIAVYGESYYHFLPAKYTADLDVSFRITKTIEVSVGGNNIFNSYPKLDDYNNTYYGSFPYPSAQMGYMGAFYYTRLNVKF